MREGFITQGGLAPRDDPADPRGVNSPNFSPHGSSRLGARFEFAPQQFILRKLRADELAAVFIVKKNVFSQILSF